MNDQAKPQSVEDRVLGALNIEGLEDDPPEQEPLPQPPDLDTSEIEAGADDEEESEEEEVKAESEDVEIEYEGERFKIPKTLEKAFLQQKDYTQKTQELANERRTIEHLQARAKAAQLEETFKQSVSEEMQRIQVLDSYMQQAKGVNWSEMSTDQLIKFRMELDQVRDQREELQKAVDAKRKAHEDEIGRAVAELREKALDVVKKSIQSFSVDSVKEVGKKQGFTEHELESILLDPRSVSVLWKAAEYDRLQASKQKAVETAKTAPPASKPGPANPMPQAVKDKLKYNKAIKAARTPQQKAKLIEERLAASFGG